jgi:hypothetical protein
MVLLITRLAPTTSLGIDHRQRKHARGKKGTSALNSDSYTVGSNETCGLINYFSTVLYKTSVNDTSAIYYHQFKELKTTRRRFDYLSHAPLSQVANNNHRLSSFWDGLIDDLVMNNVRTGHGLTKLPFKYGWHKTLSGAAL